MAKKEVKRFGHARKTKDYRRSQGVRPPGKVMVIVCEGEQTEPNYLRALRQKFRLSNLSIKLIQGKGAPISVVNCAIDEKRNLDEATDEVWCVFDTENLINNPSFKDAVEKAKHEKINLAISNPSFEYWYFVHFECSSRQFSNGQEMKKAIKKHIPRYSENLDVFSKLDPLTDDAIKNAKKLRKDAGNWDLFPNPSTGVDVLVAEIINLGSKKRY